MGIVIITLKNNIHYYGFNTNFLLTLKTCSVSNLVFQSMTDIQSVHLPVYEIADRQFKPGDLRQVHWATDWYSIGGKCCTKVQPVNSTMINSPSRHSCQIWLTSIIIWQVNNLFTLWKIKTINIIFWIGL